MRRSLVARGDVAIVAPTASGSALAGRGDASRSITLTGMEPDFYFRIVRIPDYMVLGAAGLESDDILIGTDLAKALGTALGDKVNVSTAAGAARILTVKGIFDLGNKGANERSTFVALRTAHLRCRDDRARHRSALARESRQLDHDERAVLHGR